MVCQTPVASYMVLTHVTGTNPEIGLAIMFAVFGFQTIIGFQTFLCVSAETCKYMHAHAYTHKHTVSHRYAVMLRET